MTERLLKTRFAPSPTGHIHLGNARTALFNALLARGRGHFLLRIEDTDKERSQVDYETGLMQDLQWLGMPWDEGADPDGGERGAAGPYRQAARADIYADFYDRLIAMGRAYPCFCSEQQLAISRKLQLSAGQPPRYSGTCANLKPEEVERKLAAGEKPSLRFRVPRGEVVEFVDGVRGPQKFKADDIGDFIIRRGDGGASFMFCNVIDDALMGVTVAMRGEDHLTNTPRQVMIAQALELTPPTYAHISLISGSDGAPLSKRNGSRSIRELRAEGYFPEAVVNHLARLGHYFEDTRFQTFDELAAGFGFDHLAKSPARFDEEQLRHWQKEAVLHLPEERIWAWLDEPTRALVGEARRSAFVAIVRDNAVFPPQAADWARILFDVRWSVDDAAKAALAEVDAEFFLAAKNALKDVGADFKALSGAVKAVTGKKGRELFMPLRLALTGVEHGPEMSKVTELLGVDAIAARLDAARALARC